MTHRQPLSLRRWRNNWKGRLVTSKDRFRHNLVRIMEERGITQASLARTMNVSRVAVHAWVWGTSFPEMSRVIMLAQVLKVPVGALLEDEMVTVSTLDNSNEEALLLDAFRKLPPSARLTLLARAYALAKGA